MPNHVLNEIKIGISKVIIHFANGTFDYSDPIVILSQIIGLSMKLNTMEIFKVQF